MKIGINNEVLSGIANYVYTGSLWIPQLANVDGNINVIPIASEIVDSIIEYKAGTMVGAGTYQLLGDTTPEGVLYRLTAFSYYIASATVTMVDFFVGRGAANYVAYRKISPTLNSYTSEITDVVVKEGDKFFFNFYGAANGNSFIFNLFKSQTNLVS